MTEKDKQGERILAALKESESRLNAIIDTAVDGIITIDTKGIIKSINPSALRLFKYSSKEVIGKNISILMPEPDSRKHDTYIENYHRTGVKKIIGIGRQVLGRKKNGSTFPFRLSISEVKLESGTIYTGIVHDMTEQLEAQEKLKNLNESLEQKIQERTSQLSLLIDELKESNEALNREIFKRMKTEVEIKALLEKEIELGALKSRFVSMASHEFRTPLSGILSSASLISKYTSSEDEEKRAKHVSRIKSSVENLTTILNDFLSLDKLQSGKVSIHPSEFMIQELVNEVMDTLHNILSDGRSFTYSHSGSEIELNVDRNILKNILVNLSSNAIKYSRPNTEIKIRSRINGAYLSIEIEDEGIGIPEDDKEHMFERFFRAHNAVNIKGTGLGLNIVRRYLDLLHGEITFHSEENIGTTFTIKVPIRISVRE
ncbi:MAG: PAS domain-containing sensor histidine kinase [Flavobacteriales bacterium]|nr:PAS domain-containing sensor histidine kinase [Flavobacteriales bacterium]